MVLPFFVKRMKKIIIIILNLLITANCIAQQKIVVSQDAKSKYKTIQSAIDAIPFNNQKMIPIYVKNGIYKERVVVDTRKNFINLIGESKDKTIITFNNHAGTKLENGDTLNTWTCASFFIYSDNFYVENITFENNAGFTAGQAVAVRIEGNRVAFNNCNITGLSRRIIFKWKWSKTIF